MCPYFQPLEDGDVDRYREKGVDRLVVLCLAFSEDMIQSQLDASLGSLE